MQKHNGLNGIDGKLEVLLLTVASVFLLAAYLLAAFRSYVNADAGYYLGTTEMIHQGYVPYRDFSLGYTPLLFYVLQLPRMLMGTYPSYSGYMLFLYLFVFADALLMATIVWKKTKNMKLAWLSGVLFLVFYYYFEGAYFVLESFSVCLGLLSILVLLGEKGAFWRVLVAGALSAMSFLSKQYGLLFAGVIGVMLLFADDGWRRKLRDVFGAILGFFAVIALFFLLFVVSGLSPNQLLEALGGSGYGGHSVRMYVESMARSARLFPFLFFIPCLFIGKNKANRPLMMGCLAGLVLASFQFYFNAFSHYFIYMIPFVLVLNVMLWEKLKCQKRSKVLLLLYFGMLFVSVAMPVQEVYKSSKALVKHDCRAPQTQTANQLRRIVKDYDCKSTLCYWNTIQYYGLCPLNPPMMKKYGFSFGYDTEETYLERLQNADSFVIKSEDVPSLVEMSAFEQYLSSCFSVIKNENMTDIKVFVRDK